MNIKPSYSYASILNVFIEEKYKDNLGCFRNTNFYNVLDFQSDDSSFYYDMAFFSFYYGDYKSSFFLSQKAMILGHDEGDLKLLRLAAFNELSPIKKLLFDSIKEEFSNIIKEDDEELFLFYLEDMHYLEIALNQKDINVEEDFLNLISNLYIQVKYMDYVDYYAMINLYQFFYINKFYSEALLLINEILARNLNVFNLNRKLDVLFNINDIPGAYDVYQDIRLLDPNYFDSSPNREEMYLEVFTEHFFKNSLGKLE